MKSSALAGACFVALRASKIRLLHRTVHASLSCGARTPFISIISESQTVEKPKRKSTAHAFRKMM